MTYGEIALQLDAQRRPVDAAWAYEIAIHAPDVDLGIFTNLAVLYMVCSDGGYLAHHKLSNEFVQASFERSNRILDLAEMRFPDHAEVLFWRNYIRETVLYDDVDPSIYESLALSSSSLLPKFRLHIGSNGVRYQAEMKVLHEEVMDAATERKRFIKSVLESSVLRR